MTRYSMNSIRMEFCMLMVILVPILSPTVGRVTIQQCNQTSPIEVEQGTNTSIVCDSFNYTKTVYWKLNGVIIGECGNDSMCTINNTNFYMTRPQGNMSELSILENHLEYNGSEIACNVTQNEFNCTLRIIPLPKHEEENDTAPLEKPSSLPLPGIVGGVAAVVVVAVAIAGFVIFRTCRQKGFDEHDSVAHINCQERVKIRSGKHSTGIGTPQVSTPASGYHVSNSSVPDEQVAVAVHCTKDSGPVYSEQSDSIIVPEVPSKTGDYRIIRGVYAVVDKDSQPGSKSLHVYKLTGATTTTQTASRTGTRDCYAQVVKAQKGDNFQDHTKGGTFHVSPQSQGDNYAQVELEPEDLNVRVNGTKYKVRDSYARVIKPTNGDRIQIKEHSRGDNTHNSSRRKGDSYAQVELKPWEPKRENYVNVNVDDAGDDATVTMSAGHGYLKETATAEDDEYNKLHEVCTPRSARRNDYHRLQLDEGQGPTLLDESNMVCLKETFHPPQNAGSDYSHLQSF